MKKKNLVDEQIYNLLLSKKLPFQKLEHFEHFLKTESGEAILLYLRDFSSYIGEEQHITFVRSAPVELLREYLNGSVTQCFSSLNIAKEIVARGDHESIMLFLKNKGFEVTPSSIAVSIIKRNDIDEVRKLLHFGLSDEAKIALLEFDRLNNTHEIRRFYDYHGSLSENVQIALVADGTFDQIKHYFATKFYYQTYDYKYKSIDSEKVLTILLKREDMFEHLVKEAPHLEIRCAECLIKEASHEQLMLCLNKKDVRLSQESLSFLIKRKNLDELLALKNHFHCIHISDSDISELISFRSETLVKWLLEECSFAYLKSNHALQILKNGWHHLFRQLLKSGSNGLSETGMVSVVIKAGNDEDMACVFNHIRGYNPNVYSVLISSENQKWIEMYRKKFKLKH